jgi:Trk K+ transport system NAD-binding subunit
MCGYGRFGQELTADLRDAGLDVTVIESTEKHAGPGVITGDATDDDVLARAGLETAVGLVAGTDDDTTNLSMLANARRINPKLFLAARQNRPTSAALFEAMKVDALLVPTEVVAHEVYAQISTPLLWRFIRGIPAQGEAWADQLVHRLVHSCGAELPALWKIKLDRTQAPALDQSLASRSVILGELLRSPEDRERRLDVVPLLLLRGDESVLTPDDATVLEPDDELLFAGTGPQRRELEGTLVIDSTAAYVLFDQRIPAGLVWRKLSRKAPTRVP